MRGNLGSIRRILPYWGLTQAVLGFSMFMPMILGLIDGERLAYIYGLSGAAGLTAGLLLFKCFPVEDELTHKDACLLVALTWLSAGLYGAVPYLGYGVISRFPQAFFEAVAGFSTTGASVLTDMESMERSLHLWHSVTFWLGGLGIVVLFVSMLSFFGNSGVQVYMAEVTGPIKERIAPRIKETARILLLTYIVLTLIAILVLILAGMTPFEALCHGFGAVSTGGYSTQNDSIIGYGPVVRLILAFLVMLSGMQIHLFYAAFQARSLNVFWRNEEVRVYLALILGSVLITSFAMVAEGRQMLASLLDSYVQLVCAITSTGFISTDYTAWPPVGQFFFLVLPYIGACAGSTGAGLKVGRLIILMKGMGAALTRILHPKAVVHIRINNKPAPAEAIANTQVFFFIYILIAVSSTAVFCLAGYDIRTSFSIVSACLNNVGPAFEQMGPMTHYGSMPGWSLIFLSLLMLLGRLELYAILVLFSRSFWRES
ncbi:MAG: TrkH family potassium uptake protein [Clostridiales bacterium]|nr:TrkH family potassium uptake protein [Clostridiales bacterium]